MAEGPYLKRKYGDPILADDWNDMQSLIREDLTQKTGELKQLQQESADRFGKHSHDGSSSPKLTGSAIDPTSSVTLEKLTAAVGSFKTLNIGESLIVQDMDVTARLTTLSDDLSTAQTSVGAHTHTGGMQGPKLKGDAIDATASLSVKELKVTDDVSAKNVKATDAILTGKASANEVTATSTLSGQTVSCDAILCNKIILKGQVYETLSVTAPSSSSSSTLVNHSHVDSSQGGKLSGSAIDTSSSLTISALTASTLKVRTSSGDVDVLAKLNALESKSGSPLASHSHLDANSGGKLSGDAIDANSTLSITALKVRDAQTGALSTLTFASSKLTVDTDLNAKGFITTDKGIVSNQGITTNAGLVTGTSILCGVDLTVNGKGTIAGALTVRGGLTTESDVSVTGKVSISKSLGCNELITTNAGLITGTNINCGGTVYAKGAQISGTLTVTDTAHINTIGSMVMFEVSDSSEGDNTACFHAPDVGPNYSHIHYGTKGDWFIRSAANDGKVVLQDCPGEVCIGINPTNATGYKLYVNGKLNATGGVSQISDLSLKTDLTPIDAPTARLLQVKGVQYRWKDPTLDAGQQLGVVAQDVEAAFPELVTRDSNGLRSVNYSGLIAPLIEALREQQTELVSLRAAVVQLQQQSES